MPVKENHQQPSVLYFRPHRLPSMSWLIFELAAYLMRKTEEPPGTVDYLIRYLMHPESAYLMLGGEPRSSPSTVSTLIVGPTVRFRSYRANSGTTIT